MRTGSDARVISIARIDKEEEDEFEEVNEAEEIIEEEGGE